jgi:5-methylcytosine-specific restriction endonuclease McrA
MQCKKCNKEFVPSSGLKRYCSLACRNSRNFSTATKLKIKESLKTGYSTGRLTSHHYKLEFATEDERLQFISRKNELFENRKKERYKKIMEAPFESLAFERIRERVICEQNYKCNICLIDSWQDKPISLELDHIDGESSNNTRSNLMALCPNCHSQTPTFRGRNIRTRRSIVSDEILLESLVANAFNMRQALLSVGLAAKGGNYNRCYRLKREFLSKH